MFLRSCIEGLILLTAWLFEDSIWPPATFGPSFVLSCFPKMVPLARGVSKCPEDKRLQGFLTTIDWLLMVSCFLGNLLFSHYYTIFTSFSLSPSSSSSSSSSIILLFFDYFIKLFFSLLGNISLHIYSFILWEMEMNLFLSRKFWFFGCTEDHNFKQKHVFGTLLFWFKLLWGHLLLLWSWENYLIYLYLSFLMGLITLLHYRVVKLLNELNEMITYV